VVSTQWIGSPNRWTDRGFRTRLLVLTKSIVKLLKTWWLSFNHSATVLSHWDTFPDFRQAALADRTWLWWLCHPRRQPPQRDAKGKACRLHTGWLGQVNNSILSYTGPHATNSGSF
jgi:hypothetical protein